MGIKQLGTLALLFMAPLLAYADTTSIPEPATLALLGIGAAAAAIARWGKRK